MKKKVLIIEDDRDTLDILGYLAEELNLACELKTGVLTLPEIKAINPSLILLDYWLMDGWRRAMQADQGGATTCWDKSGHYVRASATPARRG